jgi:pimeloyl-ACP methyl ester carboxylesterase
MRELYLEDLGCRVRWIDFPGATPARLFIHGLGCAGASDFAHIAAHPRLYGHRSLLIDLLGHGFSDRPGEFSYAMAAHAGVAAAVLDHLGLAGVDVVGHSMGGAVAVLLAHARPDLVARLVLCEPNLRAGGGLFSRAVAALPEEGFDLVGYAAGLTADRPELAGYAARLRLADPVAFHRSATGVVELPDPTPAELLGGLRIPCTYLLGERNLGVPGVDDPDIGVPVRVVPGAGHDMFIDNPDGFAETLAGALHHRG